MSKQCPFCNASLEDHEAGRCLDAWVHWLLLDKPTNAIPDDIREYIGTTLNNDVIPPYSTNLNDIIELWQDGWKLVKSCTRDYWYVKKNAQPNEVLGEGYNPATAICKAFIGSHNG